MKENPLTVPFGWQIPSGSLRNLNLKQEYLDTCAEDFFASSYYVDFTDPKTESRWENGSGNRRKGC